MNFFLKIYLNNWIVEQLNTVLPHYLGIFRIMWIKWCVVGEWIQFQMHLKAEKNKRHEEEGVFETNGKNFNGFFDNLMLLLLVVCIFFLLLLLLVLSHSRVFALYLLKSNTQRKGKVGFLSINSKRKWKSSLFRF